MKRLTQLTFTTAATLLTAATAAAAPSRAPIERHALPGTELGAVLFDFDSSRVEGAALHNLAKIAVWASAHPDSAIVLDAHTDHLGKGDYNTALAVHRAQMVRSKLVAMGVEDARIVLAIYGERGPHRGALALDRRVNIWTTATPLGLIVDRTLFGGEAAIWTTPVTQAQLDDRSATASIALQVRGGAGRIASRK